MSFSSQVFIGGRWSLVIGGHGMVCVSVLVVSVPLCWTPTGSVGRLSHQRRADKGIWGSLLWRMTAGCHPSMLLCGTHLWAQNSHSQHNTCSPVPEIGGGGGGGGGEGGGGRDGRRSVIKRKRSTIQSPSPIANTSSNLYHIPAPFWYMWSLDIVSTGRSITPHAVSSGLRRHTLSLILNICWCELKNNDSGPSLLQFGWDG